uniref:FAD-dependent oxidoreductase n=1 Tax=Streptomyces sp. E5N91 TaxID=1851996 RepID=UPI00187D5321
MSLSGVTVVGASAAGLGVAENLRREGFAGRITLVGGEPHLPYDRPPLSKQFLSGAWDTARLRLRAPEALDALDVALHLGVRATGLDTARRQVVLADGERIGYDALVVATGVRPRVLPGTRGLTGVHRLRTVEDALALREALRPGCLEG